MTNKRIKGIVAIALLSVLAGCDDNAQAGCAAAGDACKTFTVLHTNDNHGRFWENKYGEYGMAARKTLIAQIRAEVESKGGETLLLSGGDINTGVPESDLQDAEPDFIGMNLLGYDAMAVGNHEFDNHLDVLEKQRKWANFPMLAANIYKANGSRYFDAYKVFNVNGLRVAVIGLTTEDTAKIGNPEFISELTFVDPQVEVKKVIDEINISNAADVIFATTHMGHYADGQHGSNAPGDVSLARSLEEGKLQAIIGGHSQNALCMEPGSDQRADFKPGDACMPDQQKGTWIMQANEWGKYVGRADFEYYDGKLHLTSYSLIPVNLKVKNSQDVRVLVGDEIIPDPVVQSILHPYQQQGQEQLNVNIATTNGFLEGPSDGAGVRYKQTNLGRLIATAHRTKMDTDFSVMNSGGVRASIEEGDIAYRDVLTVQPFANIVTKNTMTGSDVLNYLNVVAIMQIGSGAYAQITGVKMTVDCQAETVNISEINSETFNVAESYTFTVPSFSAAGGDDYPLLENAEITGYVDAAVLKEFLQGKDIDAASYNPVGDIQYINSDSNKGCQLLE